MKASDAVEAEFADHMECQGLVSDHDSPRSDADEQDILAIEKEDGETMPLERTTEDLSSGEGDPPCQRPLHLEAEAGLREILDEFQLSEDLIDEIIGSVGELARK